MAELILKFIQISAKCHCLKSLVLDNIPVRKLNTVCSVLDRQQTEWLSGPEIHTIVTQKSILEKKSK